MAPISLENGLENGLEPESISGGVLTPRLAADGEPMNVHPDTVRAVIMNVDVTVHGPQLSGIITGGPMRRRLARAVPWCKFSQVGLQSPPREYAKRVSHTVQRR